MSALALSAMNGFDKGIEIIYSRESTPVVSTHSVRALGHYQKGLPRLVDADQYDHAVLATQLVQYDRKQISSTHLETASRSTLTFSKALCTESWLHMSSSMFLLMQTPGEIRLLRDWALKLLDSGDAEVASQIVETVQQISNALNLPSQLRDIKTFERNHFDLVAEEILHNYKHNRNPPDIDPTHREIVSILDEAW